MLPVEVLDTEVAALTAGIAARSRLTVTAAKEIVDMAATGRVDPERVAAWHRRSLKSGEAAEGVRAFAERRTPDFTWTPAAPDAQTPAG